MASTGLISLQGSFYMAPRGALGTYDSDGVISPMAGLSEVGNVVRASFQLKPDSCLLLPSATGARRTKFKNPSLRRCPVQIELEDVHSIINLKTVLQGGVVKVKVGLTEAAYLLDRISKAPEYVPTKTIPDPDTIYYVGVKDKGVYAPVPMLNVGALTIRDSNASAVTLSEGVHYTVVSRRDGRIKFNDLTTYGLAYPLRANFFSGSVTDILSSTLIPGLIYKLSYQDVTSFVLKDALNVSIPFTKYELDAATGFIVFNDLFDSDDYTLPLKATYTAGVTTHVPLMSAPAQREYWLFFSGLDTTGSNQKVALDLYRVVFDPADQFDLLHNDIGSVTLKGVCLSDSNLDPDGIMGQLGRYILI